MEGEVSDEKKQKKMKLNLRKMVMVASIPKGQWKEKDEDGRMRECR